MPRRQRHEEHENHERWLVSYADFITLLFAFFVVMYSVSSVNDGKYRVLSDSMTAAFSGPTKSLSPIQIGEVTRSPQTDGMNAPSTIVASEAPGSETLIEIQEVPRGDGDEHDTGPDVKEGQGTSAESDDDFAVDPQNPGAAMANVDEVADTLDQEFADLVDDEFVEIKRKGDWIEIEMKSSFLFGSGSSRMQGIALPVIRRLSTILKRFPNPVQVEGFTDNVPISTLAFPSNWELSAARAASVVHLMTKYRVRPDRLTAIGYGEYQPIASNKTEQGRGKNRRVVIVIPAEIHTRQFLDLKRTVDRSRKKSFGETP